MYLIMATDGFWDIVRIEQLSALVKEWKENEEELKLSHFLMDFAANQTTAYKKDNMTLLIIDL